MGQGVWVGFLFSLFEGAEGFQGVNRVKGVEGFHRVYRIAGVQGAEGAGRVERVGEVEGVVKVVFLFIAVGHLLVFSSFVLLPAGNFRLAADKSLSKENKKTIY